MAFTVEDFKDLLDLLERHPEWKGALRASLLGEELLQLPELVRAIAAEVRALAEAQKRTEQRLDELAAEVRALAEAQRRTEQRVEELAEAQKRTEQRVERLETRVGALVGSDLERRYREHAHAFFFRILKGIRVVDPQVLQQLLEGAVAAGRITEDEQQDVLLADVVVSGRHSGEEAYLVVEVSAEVRARDVERAARRAELLQRATGTRTLAAVAGERVEAEADSHARSLGVWRVLDGVAYPP